MLALETRVWGCVACLLLMGGEEGESQRSRFELQVRDEISFA